MSENKTTLESIIKTEAEVRNLGFGIQNNIIERVDVDIVGHFNNSTSLTVTCQDIIVTGYNNTQNLGYLIRAFVKLFNLDTDDDLYLSSIKNLPCRLVFDDAKCQWGSKCIGFGHFMDDKFVMINNFMKING